MKSWRLAIPFIAVVLCNCSTGSGSQLRLATGASAQTLCNAAFVSRLDPKTVLRDELHRELGMALIDWVLRYKVDRKNKAVDASVFGGWTANAVFREGRGCTLVFPGGALPRPVAVPQDTIPAVIDIAGPEILEPANPALKAAIDAAFAEPGNGAPQSTQAIVVVHGGRVIGERYAPGITIDTPLNSHSVAKSVINALVGILVREGKLRLDQSITVPASPEDGRGATTVTIAQLLRMNAGFGFDEGVGGTNAYHIWYEQGDTATASITSLARSPREAAWGYCNRCYSILAKVAGDAVGGGPQGMTRFLSRELFGPLGMHSVVPEFDQAGTLMGANAIFASPRDFARFGLLYLYDGVIGDRRILPPGWVAMTRSPTPGSGYGAGFWLNTMHAPMPRWRMNWGLPQAPADTFFARGYLGQYIVIVPSSELVIVRMGQAHGAAEAMESVGQLTGELVRIVQAR